ncbi:MAG: hypothetical protein OXU75_22170 [Deltaproteobacteria bacterium]|nr:hypothetical protein [Deltaproteobacteria bacterium]
MPRRCGGAGQGVAASASLATIARTGFRKRLDHLARNTDDLEAAAHGRALQLVAETPQSFGQFLPGRSR